MHVNSVELGPQDITLELQSCNRLLLRLEILTVLEHDFQTMLAVACCQRRTRSKVGKRGGIDPVVMFF